MIDTELEIYLVGQLTRLGGTSLCGNESSWCCLQPKICRIHQLPHRRPASPQTGGRGCGKALVEAGQGWSRSRREGTVPHLRGSWRHHDLRPSLALRQETIADIKSTNKYIFRIKYIYTSNHFNSFCPFVLPFARWTKNLTSFIQAG